MDTRQRTILRRRLRDAIAQQPEIEVLRSLLLAIGGAELVAPASLDPDIRFLIDFGFIMAGTVKCKDMERSLSHENIARLWKAKYPGLVGVGTGYALSDDGLWRQHSWGVRRDGILETTKQREKYFGIVLQESDADAFAASNLYRWVLPECLAKLFH